MLLRLSELHLDLVSHVLTVSLPAVPLLSRILPSDACKIYKQGLNIRQVGSTNVTHLSELVDVQRQQEAKLRLPGSKAPLYGKHTDKFLDENINSV